MIRQIELAVAEAAEGYSADVEVSLGEEEIFIRAASDTVGGCPLLLSGINEQSIDVSLGDVAHFDIYASHQGDLVREIRDIVTHVVQGNVVETRWYDAAGRPFAATIRLGDRKISWRKGCFRPKWASPTSTFRYSPYQLLSDNGC